MGLDRPDREKDGGQRCPDGGRGAKRTETLGADVEDVARIEGKHRGYAAEQDCEQVERDRSEHQFVMAHILDALDHPLDGPPGLDPGARNRPDQEQAERGKGEQQGAERIGKMRNDVVEDSARRRADDGTRLPRCRTQCDRLRKLLPRHQIGRKRTERGSGKSTRHSEQRGDREEDRQVYVLAPGRPKQHRRAGHFEEDGRSCDLAAVQPIRRPAANRGEKEQRHELDEPDQPELERRLVDRHRLAGDVVDLPADDDHHRHLRHRRRQPRQPEGAERRDSHRFGKQAHFAAVEAARYRGNWSLDCGLRSCIVLPMAKPDRNIDPPRNGEG